MGGGGGGGVSRIPIQLATDVVSCFKQTSQRLLELPKIPLPLFVCACKRLDDRNGVDCVSQSIVSVNVL